MRPARLLARAALALVCGMAGCSQDVGYDPHAPADSVEACMVLALTFCERDIECRRLPFYCEAEEFRELCEEQLADNECGPAVGDQLLECADEVRELHCNRLNSHRCRAGCYELPAPASSSHGVHILPLPTHGPQSRYH